MHTSEQLKQIVKDKYSMAALQSKDINQASCCGSGGCSTTDSIPFAEDYSALTGYNANADLGLGCGLPTQYAYIKPGNIVVDLGSGAGNDCFVARAETGPTGKVIGIDMTEAMIEKARLHTKKLGYTNIEFRLGDIENLPVSNNSADVVVSNCVLNLVPDKKQAFSEIYRILKPGGHFSISDVVLNGTLPESLQTAAEMYAGCVSGAILKEEYLAIIQKAGFKNIHIQKEKYVYLPNDILLNYISETELKAFRESGAGVYSITVYADKPKTSLKNISFIQPLPDTSENMGFCSPNSGCC